MKENCIFCKLADVSNSANHVMVNEHAVIIKDKNPIAPHHVLVMPISHYGDIGDLLLIDDSQCTLPEKDRHDKEVLADMFRLVDDYVCLYMLNPGGGYRLVTNVGPDAGQTVKHLHFHLLGGAPLKNDFGA